MRQKKTILLFVTLVLAAFASSVGVQCYADDDDPPVIIILDDGSLGGDTGHHAPALIPIQAEYYPSLSTIMVDFLFDMGSVSVEIENLTTGAYSQTVINATQGAHPLVIAGTAGVYEITFTLMNGVVYIGSFEIE